MISVASVSTAIAPLPGQLAAWAALDGDSVALTFLDHRRHPAGRAISLTWRQLDDRATDIAVWLRSRVDPGDPVAIMADQSPQYVTAFLGILRAGAVAVPLFGPDLPGHGDRLAAVLADCSPRLVLTGADDFGQVRAFLDDRGMNDVPVCAVEEVPQAGEEIATVTLAPDDVAYLQYTSGSTGTPRGVVITHGNVVANARQACAAYGVSSGQGVTVSWLPLFHDMGLMLSVAGPLVSGARTVLMRPLAFLEQPLRWLQALSDNPGAVTAAPGFAYAYAAARVRGPEKALLRLDTVLALVDGSEPVRPAAIERFREAFTECGLRPEAHRPSYGLAEATVYVSASTAGSVARGRRFDRAALADGWLTEAPEGGIEFVSCGRSIDQRVLVVDPGTEREVPDGTVGEIWVNGPNVGRGYWNRPVVSAAVFGARLADRPGLGRWLRTGDLGARHEGELYVTGRIKDLIIVDGRNHYPQDVEDTVESAHDAVRPRNSVAFAVSTPGGERAVVLAERNRRIEPGDVDTLRFAATVRAAVARRHGLALQDVRLVEPDTLPRTSSGKIARSACRDRYLAEFA
ncbi:fatty acyl-AMP ligase [Amycolatopsis keratiniphila]|uniref:fatty acyl-AMP ligase n=1 Tax=Amycolatopsis keratiniphila TaxID=129921 RepID=UPI000B14CE04|nr:fatty acyl-AMP ligase [Amycolatopsis keratiniphila]